MKQNELAVIDESLEVQLKQVKELGGLKVEESDKLIAIYQPMILKLKEFESRYNSIIEESKVGINKELVANARRLRLDMVPVRTGTERVRKEKNELAQLEIKANNGVGAQVALAIVGKEKALSEIENYFENLEKERLEKLQSDRVLLLSKYVENAELRDLTKFEQDEFEALLAMKKKEYEDFIEAERLAEEQRQEAIRKEAEEKEALRIENEKLKQEAEAKEKLRLEELAEAKRIQDAKDAEAKAIRDEEIRVQAEKDAKIKAEKEEADRLQAKKDLEAKKERERIEADLLKAKQEAEDARLKAEKIESDRIENERLAKQAELSKGDADKVNDLIEALELLKTKFTFESDSNKKMYSQVGDLLTKVINHITR